MGDARQRQHVAAALPLARTAVFALSPSAVAPWLLPVASNNRLNGCMSAGCAACHPPNAPALPPSLPHLLLQLFLEQNEEEAEKMEAKEEKQREIEKSQIKVRRLRAGSQAWGR